MCIRDRIGGSRQEMERIENELKMVSYHLTKGEQLENILNNTFKEIEDITDAVSYTHLYMQYFQLRNYHRKPGSANPLLKRL